jgi:hypothetical protein
MKRGVIGLLACLVVLSAPGSQVIFPPLNKDTLVGTRGALAGDRPLGLMLARLEISREGPSFFAYQVLGKPAPNQVNVFRMISCDITDEKISLRFRGEDSEGGPFDWFFEGTGEGTFEEGAMSGRLFTQYGGPAPKEKNAFFLKAAWTRWLTDRSREVEQGIAKARAEAKP